MWLEIDGVLLLNLLNVSSVRWDDSYDRIVCTIIHKSGTTDHYTYDGDNYSARYEEDRAMVKRAIEKIALTVEYKSERMLNKL